MELKYNFFAEWPISLMCLILASCTINKACKKSWWRREKGYTLFQAWGWVTWSNISNTGLYVSTYQENVCTDKGLHQRERASCLCVGKRRHKCSRSVRKRTACMLFVLFIFKGKMSWIHSSHKLHSHTLHTHVYYLATGNILLCLSGNHLAWWWQEKTTRSSHHWNTNCT